MNKKVKLYSSLFLIGLTLGSTFTSSTVKAAKDNSTTMGTSLSADNKKTIVPTDGSDQTDKYSSVSTNSDMGPGYYNSEFNLNS